MKDSFKEYYRPDDNEFEELWNNCEFVFDANVLLNVYRYSLETSDEFFKILKAVQDRLWLPHQVALEYQRNRFSVIEEQVTKYKELEKLLGNNDIINFLQNNKRHPFIDTESVTSKLANTLEELKTDIKTRRDNYPNSVSNDELRDTITELFDGKVGNECPEEKLGEIYNLGKKRFAEKIPPGFEDRKKDGTNEFGDLILWCQLIIHAKTEGRPIIFVTDDVKKDWWLKRSNAIISPHPLLIREMRLEAGILFYIYRTEKFMENAKKYLKLDVTDNSLQEIEKVQDDIIDRDIFLKNWLESKFQFNDVNTEIKKTNFSHLSYEDIEKLHRFYNVDLNKIYFIPQYRHLIDENTSINEEILDFFLRKKVEEINESKKEKKDEDIGERNSD